jgi:exodeoxyribonuclease VII small subunit
MEKSFNVEATFLRIEEIVKILESGKQSLAENMTLFEEANQLIKAVEKALSEAEQKITEIVNNK